MSLIDTRGQRLAALRSQAERLPSWERDAVLDAFDVADVYLEDVDRVGRERFQRAREEEEIAAARATAVSGFASVLEAIDAAVETERTRATDAFDGDRATRVREGRRLVDVIDVDALLNADEPRIVAGVIEKRERDVETLIALELGRLDDVTRAMVPRAREGNSKAAAVLVRASESRRRLLGLDAATRVELSGRSGGPIVTRDDDRPYEHWTDAQIFERLERVREQLRETMADEARAMTDQPLTPTFDESPEEIYARRLAERARNRTN